MVMHVTNKLLLNLYYINKPGNLLAWLIGTCAWLLVSVCLHDFSPCEIISFIKSVWLRYVGFLVGPIMNLYLDFYILFVCTQFLEDQNRFLREDSNHPHGILSPMHLTQVREVSTNNR